jgi:crotonobetainyl-CoA:carnitine CoA-transferase CaiB-like acyl-CoA transferase
MQDSSASNEAANGPLAGLRVMDASIMAAGPWVGALLGMLGAEVIKVESPDGDGTRFLAPTQNGMGTNFISMNVNKKDIVLDLKSEEGLQAAHALAASCDVFIQNFRVGVVDRLRLDDATLRALNPRLVYCAISGFGETGPLAKAGCADYIMQAYAGFARMNGTPGEELEAFRFTGFLDLGTASVAVQAILAALLERDQTGLGQRVEVSMLEAALEMETTRVADYLGAGLVAGPLGSASSALAPDRAYAALDQEIFLTVHDDGEWQAFCAGLDLQDAARDPRFSSNTQRVAHRQEIDALIEPVLRKRPALWWQRVLQRHDVACAIAHSFDFFRYHQQVLDNEMIANIDTPDWGAITVGGAPWHFSATPCRVTSAPKPSAHTEEVLRDLAQRSAKGAAA